MSSINDETIWSIEAGGRMAAPPRRDSMSDLFRVSL